MASLFDDLPTSLRRRFAYIESYCTQTVSHLEDVLGIPKHKRLRQSSETMQQIRLCVMLYTLQRFLDDGAFATEQAATAYAELETDGFYIGMTQYTPTNSNTRRPRRLLDKLNVVVAQLGLSDQFGKSNGPKHLIENLYREATNR